VPPNSLDEQEWRSRAQITSRGAAASVEPLALEPALSSGSTAKGFAPPAGFEPAHPAPEAGVSYRPPNSAKAQVRGLGTLSKVYSSRLRKFSPIFLQQDFFMSVM